MFKSIDRSKTVKQKGWGAYQTATGQYHKIGVHKARKKVPCYYMPRTIDTMMKVNFVCASRALP